MPVKKYKPITPGRRQMIGQNFDEITKSRPERSLVRGKSSSGGRNATGRITLRFRGGGHKRRYRFIDFRRDKDGVPAKVVAIEYDPNRSARIALLHYADGEKRYILAPLGLEVGQTVMSGPDADIRVGNALPLRYIPVGAVVHNVELHIGKGGQLARAAGTSAQLVAKEEPYATLRLPSGEMRMVHWECRATIGQVGNVEHENEVIGKAGRKRWLGRRPRQRGLSMNPVDHPHGGGEGKAPIGMPTPKTPWGKPALGVKTRKRNKPSDRLIIRRRKR